MPGPPFRGGPGSSSGIVLPVTPARAFLGIFRLLIGLGAWFAPDATVRLFGIDPERSDRFIGRLFGTREFTLAAALLAAPPRAVTPVATVGAAVDTVDAIAGFDEMRRGNLSTRAILLGPVGVIGFAALGFYVAREAADGIDAGSA